MTEFLSLSLESVDNLLWALEENALIPGNLPDEINFRVPEKMFTNWTDLEGICRARMLDKFMKSTPFEGFTLSTWSDGRNAGETHSDAEGFQSTGFRYYRLTRVEPQAQLRIPERAPIDV